MAGLYEPDMAGLYTWCGPYTHLARPAYTYLVWRVPSTSFATPFWNIPFGVLEHSIRPSRTFHLVYTYLAWRVPFDQLRDAFWNIPFGLLEQSIWPSRTFHLVYTYLAWRVPLTSFAMSGAITT